MSYDFFFNDTATSEIYTLSLHDALPISSISAIVSLRLSLGMKRLPSRTRQQIGSGGMRWRGQDRKSTRLNSSHVSISYAVFCLKKKKQTLFSSRCRRTRI